MSTTSRVAGAVAAGYALGRFKKLRLAILVGTAMSSPKFRSAAAGMLQDRIPGGAITGTLTKEVGGRLVSVGKTAATSIVASRIDTLSQSLAERSQNLKGVYRQCAFVDGAIRHRWRWQRVLHRNSVLL